MAHSNDQLALWLLAEASASDAREAGQRQLDTRAAAARQAEVDAALGRLGGDLLAAILAGGLALTVLGPFLIGQFVMKKTFVLKPSPAVYAEKARGIWDHFLPTYLAGLIPIALGLGVFLVARTPWRHRMISVVGGWAVLAATVGLLLPWAMSEWGDSERKTAAKLRETAYPLDRRADRVCVSWDFPAENGLRQSERWLVAISLGAASQTCSRVSVYRGWRPVGSFTLSDGNAFTGTITVRYPSWPEPVSAEYGTTISQTSRRTGELVNMNPIVTEIRLPTEYGSALTFTLDGAGSNAFRLS